MRCVPHGFREDLKKKTEEKHYKSKLAIVPQVHSQFRSKGLDWQDLLKTRTSDSFICTCVNKPSWAHFYPNQIDECISILYILVILIPKCVIWQTVKTQMKCHIMHLFIRVCTICKDKKTSSAKEINFIWKLETVTP